MKVLITILIGLLVVGCGKNREVTPENVIGTYERQVEEGNVFRMVFLKDGNMEFYSEGKKLDKNSVLGSNKWRMEGSEIRTTNKEGNGYIYTIEKNGDLTEAGLFGVLVGRLDHSKEDQITFKKIK